MRIHGWLLSATALIALAACAGEEKLRGMPPEHPPEGAGGFDPTGGAQVGSASGSASASASASGAGGSAGSTGQGGEGGGPPMCDDASKRCNHEFTYPAGSEQSVVLRGSFAPDGWTVGVPLMKQGPVWTVTVALPYATEVDYKFFIDGSTWVTDPANPKLVPDGVGGQNSALDPIACSDWICVGAQVWSPGG